MTQDELYRQAADEFGAALERLARAYEPNDARRADLSQEIHIALWRSLAVFDGRCSLRTWVYRVAHNIAATHVIRGRRSRMLVSLEALESAAAPANPAEAADRRMALARLYELIHELAPLDRQIILLYVEGLDAGAIAEITGLSPGNVAVKVHRVKNVLARQFHQGGAK